ncbi:TonB-dependent receptor [Tenacibaculum finnmarkense]|nr:TonB-dependent receptor [Tenacibaculum finnmarkense]
MDMEKSSNQFLIYPDLEISYPIITNALDMYIGASGDLKTNNYHDLATKNPYISPTQKLLQTSKYEAFAGFRGKLKHQFSYHLKASYADIENKAFSSLNQSKSNGKNNAGSNAFSLFGYEYGNSFNTNYDNVSIISGFGELAFDGIKNLSIGLNGQYNQFTLTTQTEPWNTPEIKGELFGTYKADKWFAGTNLFFVGQRKGKLHAILPQKTFTTVNLDSYFDINFNGGYHFSDSFSVFLNLNNVLNNEYQRFHNFNVQGFQAMAGLTWKFDAIL